MKMTKKVVTFLKEKNRATLAPTLVTPLITKVDKYSVRVFSGQQIVTKRKKDLSTFYTTRKII